MYLWAQSQDMPLGPGLLWEKSGNRFKKKIMASQMSFGQIQWLNYIQESDCIDRQGRRVQLQYGYFHGEVEFEGEIKIDLILAISYNEFRK